MLKLYENLTGMFTFYMKSDILHWHRDGAQLVKTSYQLREKKKKFSSTVAALSLKTIIPINSLAYSKLPKTIVRVQMVNKPMPE